MLEQITWSQYCTTIGVTTAVYYAGIGIIFYRKKIISAFNRTSPPTNHYASASPENIKGAILSAPNTDEGQSPAEALSKKQTEEESAEAPTETTTENIRTLDKTTETGDLINEALTGLGVNTNSQELIITLSAVIQNQNADGSLRPFRNTLDWHIHQSALDSCGISLEKEDLDAIWEKADVN